MNRVLSVLILMVCIAMGSSSPVTGEDYKGMEYYKQADLQCLTHPDLFNKWSCRKKADKEKAVVIPEVEEPKEDKSLPPREEEPLEWKPLPVKTVYFDYDKSNLKPEGKAAIQRNVQFLKDKPNARILIEGHCDERGTNEYNLALGERRATSVMNYMTDLGISASRITTKSWGEERPVDPGHNESAWWKNRRGEMFFSEE